MVALFLLIHDLPDKYGGSPTDPEVSPLLYPSQAGLPPTFFQIAGLDPLRDEGLLYEKLLREACVKTRLIMYVRLLIVLPEILFCSPRSCVPAVTPACRTDSIYPIRG